MEFTYTIKGITLNADEAEEIHKAYVWFLDASKINRVLALNDMELAYKIAEHMQSNSWNYAEDLLYAIEGCTHDYPENPCDDAICVNPELFHMLNKKFDQAQREGRIL